MPGMCVVLMGTLINYKRGCSKHFIIVAVVWGGGGGVIKGAGRGDFGFKAVAFLVVLHFTINIIFL